jgi:putative phosphoesterase
MKILGVRGNCDSEVDQMLLEFPCTSDYLIFFSEKRRCFVTHGHLYTDGNHPPLAEGDVFIYGHTHVPVLEKKEGLIFLNPGSISLPKDGSEAGYAILDASGIYLKTLDGTELSRLDF